MDDCVLKGETVNAEVLVPKPLITYVSLTVPLLPVKSSQLW